MCHSYTCGTPTPMCISCNIETIDCWHVTFASKFLLFCMCYQKSKLISEYQLSNLERVPFVVLYPPLKKKPINKKKTVFSLFISCYLTLFCVSNIHVSQLILFHHDKTRHLTWSRTRRPDPWRARRALYQCTQRGWADSFGSHDNYKGESTDSVISLLYSH